jgi:ribose transport system permease protein
MTRISFRKLQPFSIIILTAILWIVSIGKSNNVPFWLGNLLTYAAPIGVIACGMTFVMIAGGFDLSVGSIAAVCGVVTVLVMKRTSGGAALVIPIAVIATLLAGAILGAINGILIANVGVNPFVVTLSTMFVFRGIGLVLTRGGQSQVVPLKLTEAFRVLYWGGANFFGVKFSVPLFIFAGVFIACVYVLRFTRFGHYVYATGGNAKASWLAGINTPRITAVTYIISGITCAIAALIWTALSGTAQASDYAGTEMIVIASVIVGGTPLGGGRGGLFATLSGLLLLATIDQLLTQFGVDPQYRQIVTGLMILTVVAIDSYSKRSSS